MQTQKTKDMPFGWALFCIAFLLCSMVASVLWLDIPVHINLLTSIAVTLGVAWLNGKPWKNGFRLSVEEGEAYLVNTRPVGLLMILR